MKARILVAVVCIPLLLVVLLWLPTLATAILAAGLCALAAHELTYATGLITNRRVVGETMLMAALVPFWSWCGCPAEPAMAGGLAFFLVLAAELLASRLKMPFEVMTAALFAGLGMPWLLSALVRLIQQPDGRFLVLLPLLISFAADGAALFAGMALGRHKLAPVISPKKTVEGMIGGFVGAVAGMLIYGLVVRFAFGREFHWLTGVLLALCGAGVSVIGDLFFSCLKREKQIKDYGRLLPGHGGVLDRFDSVLFCAPLCELLLCWLPLL